MQNHKQHVHIENIYNDFKRGIIKPRDAEKTVSNLLPEEYKIVVNSLNTPNIA